MVYLRDQALPTLRRCDPIATSTSIHRLPVLQVSEIFAFPGREPLDFLDNQFELPAPPADISLDPEGCWPPLPFDLRLSWLSRAYGASVKAWIECGLLDGAFVAGEWWVERRALEHVVRDAGYSTFDETGPAYIPASLLAGVARREWREAMREVF